MAIVLVTAVSFVARAKQSAGFSHERAFAVQKGISLLEEVRNYTQLVGDFGEIDALDDGVVHNPILTLQDVPSPDHEASGNVSSSESESGWHYSRRLIVKPFAGLDIRDLRIVSALVYREARPGGKAVLLADVGTVLRSPGDQAFPTSQNYDVYFMAVQNIPGWWVYMSYIKPLMEVTVEDLQARNPGLVFRAHWITKASYGRNPRYMPYINKQNDSYQDIDWVYFYPGKMPLGSSADEYYVPDQMTARMLIDGVETHGYDPDVNPLPYSLADEYNHGMRYIDELRYFKDRCEVVLNDPVTHQPTDPPQHLEDPLTPTWRIMLERMCTEPEMVENAILINLHGELLPMPAIRNYSDPARDPCIPANLQNHEQNHNGMRVVTHPEYLCTPTVEDLRFRVYAYQDLCDEQLKVYPLIDGFEGGLLPQVWDSGGVYTQVVSNPFHSTPNSLRLEGAAGSGGPSWVKSKGNWAQECAQIDFWLKDIDLLQLSSNNGAFHVHLWDDTGQYIGEVGQDRDLSNQHLYIKFDGEPESFSSWDLTLMNTNWHQCSIKYKNEGNLNTLAVYIDGAEIHRHSSTLRRPFGNVQFEVTAPGANRARVYLDDIQVRPVQQANEISVLFRHVNLTYNLANPVRVHRVFGGADGSDDDILNRELDFYGREMAVAPLGYEPDASNPPPLNQMSYYVKYIDPDPNDQVIGDTLIRFFNTPLVCPEVEDPISPGDYQGLAQSWRLYGLDYIPCSTEAACDFSQDLADNVQRPKNTARWFIEIPHELADTGHPDSGPSGVPDELADPHDGVIECTDRITLETRIGSDLTTGVMWPQEHKAENLSRTYAWWSDDRSVVPFSERSQFIGDPRHCPYADLKDIVPFTSFSDQWGNDNPFRNRYNWWFDNFKNSAHGSVMNYWQGFNAQRIQNDEGNDNDGWADDHMRIDVPRYMELLRTGLMAADTVYTTLTGYSYYYMAIGNEIGYDSANGFAKGIPVSKKPFYGVSGQRTEQTISGASPDDGGLVGTGMKVIKRGINDWSDYWWGKQWMGELYPDSSWNDWAANGNLPTGTGNDEYIRLKREGVNEDLPLGTTLTLCRRRLKPEGCNSFFLIGDRQHTFYHAFNSGNGTLTSTGTEIATDYAFPLPTSAFINRPFRLDWEGGWGWDSNDEFDFTTDYPHNTAVKLATYYDHPWSYPNGLGAALIALNPPTFNTEAHSSYQVINGLNPTIESGSAFIAKWSLLTLIHSFLSAGHPIIPQLPANRIEQLPRIEIKAPTIITALDDPNYITVVWSTEFLRWDGEKYNQYYPDGFSDSDWLNNLRYLLLYSNDNGDTWYFMEDDPAAAPQEWQLNKRPTGPFAAYLLLDQDSGNESFSWATPAGLFPESSYLIRIETYRDTKALHTSSHMEKIFIDR
jgi:hypothetical protein